MNKVLIVIMFILLGTSLIVVSNMNKGVENSFTIEYHNNKNLSLPDLTGGESIAPNVYRINSIYGVTLDYNINNGVWVLNGTTSGITTNAQLLMSTISPIGVVSATYIRVGGTNTSNDSTVLIRLSDAPIAINIGFNQNTQVINGYQNNHSSSMYIRLINGVTFDNLQFKLQVEKGSQATSYVVPKLIPIYKDNLTQQEKQEIGFGAFGGLSQIIRSVDNVIKPIGNFINGVLNLFK